jgi:hypothetical protein
VRFYGDFSFAFLRWFFDWRVSKERLKQRKPLRFMLSVIVCVHKRSGKEGFCFTFLEIESIIFSPFEPDFGILAFVINIF